MRPMGTQLVVDILLLSLEISPDSYNAPIMKFVNGSVTALAVLWQAMSVVADSVGMLCGCWFAVDVEAIC